MTQDKDERAATRAAFKDAVNTSAKQVEEWLETAESRSVGQTHPGEHEAVGHKEGRRIVSILRMKQADLTDEDYADMTKVIGYVHRHLKQRPGRDVSTTRWRYSLMNWGHDPA